jgi:hypothetical protein
MFPSVTILRRKYLDIFQAWGKARAATRDRGTAVLKRDARRSRGRGLTPHRRHTGEPGQVVMGTRGARDGPTLPGGTDGLWV